MTVEDSQSRSLENVRLENLREEKDDDQINVQALHIVNKRWSVHVGAGNSRDILLIEPSPSIETGFDCLYRFGLAQDRVDGGSDGITQAAALWASFPCRASPGYNLMPARFHLSAKVPVVNLRKDQKT